jgi:hypothetical protein
LQHFKKQEWDRQQPIDLLAFFLGAARKAAWLQEAATPVNCSENKGRPDRAGHIVDIAAGRLDGPKWRSASGHVQLPVNE